jgi:hypothetical protein
LRQKDPERKEQQEDEQDPYRKGPTGRLLVVDDGRLRALLTRAGITRFVRTKIALEEPVAS